MKNTFQNTALSKTFLAVLFLLVTAQAMAQKTTYETLIDEKNGNTVFKGKCTFTDLYTEQSFDWMRTGSSAYAPDEKAIKTLNGKLNKYSILVFLGTWCGDSKDLVPELYKVLDLIHYPVANVTIYGVDRPKTTGTGVEKTYGITNVPTIIVLDGKKEIGRITESVDNSMEADLAAIVAKHKK